VTKREAVEDAWERTASQIWHSFGCPKPPIDPYKLIARHKLRLLLARRSYPKLGAFLMRSERVIYLDPALSQPQRYFAAAHELMHWLLPRAKEREVSYVAMGVLLPEPHVRPGFEANWEIMAHHAAWCPHLSVEVMLRRFLSLREGVCASVWDEGEASHVLRSPARRYSRPSALERHLAERLFDDRALKRFQVDERAYAVAVDSNAFRRVVTVIEHDQLHRHAITP
jgi:hypothetical protein